MKNEDECSVKVTLQAIETELSIEEGTGQDKAASTLVERIGFGNQKHPSHQ